jgi:hypothetical protein
MNRDPPLRAIAPLGYKDKRLVSVVETPTYLRRAESLLSEPERAHLVDVLAADPASGDLITGTGGLRKVRVGVGGRGKRGGARVVTFFHDEGMPVFLLMIYAKNEQGDLTQDQRRVLKRLVDGLRAEYGR